MASVPSPPLRRPADGRLVAGVCAGLAERLGVDPLLVRVGFIAAATTGLGIAVYALGWLLMPVDGSDGPVRRIRTGRAALEVGLGAGLLVLSALLAMRGLGGRVAAGPRDRRRRAAVAPVADARVSGGRLSARDRRARAGDPARRQPDRRRDRARHRRRARVPAGHRRTRRRARRGPRRHRRRGRPRRDLRSVPRPPGARARPAARARGDLGAPARLRPADARARPEAGGRPGAGRRPRPAAGTEVELSL